MSSARAARTHGNVVETVKVREGLCISFVLNEFFRTTVKEADVLQVGIKQVCGSSCTGTHGVSSENFLSIEFQNHTEHTVSSGVLRTVVRSERSMP